MSDDSEDREAASRARSAEILANEPTEAELLEQAERARKNKIDRIMQPSRPPPPVIVKIRPDALLEGQAGSPPRPEAARPVPSGLARHGTGRSAAEQRLAEWWADHIATLWIRLKDVGSNELARTLLQETAASDIARQRRDGVAAAETKKRFAKMKKRIRALEQAYAAVKDAPKPRVRVPAGRLPH